MKRKRLYGIASCFLLVSTLLTACGQQGSAPEAKTAGEYPKKAIKMIVPFTPGGNTDLAARIIAQAANKHLPNGQTIVVENKPGGGGTVGSTEVVKTKPDGYVIGMTTGGPITIQPHFGKTAYTPDNIQPIMRVVSMSNVLVVRSDSPWKTFDEWLEYVKQNPGQFKYSTAGTGLSGHITMEALDIKAGIDTKQVPFEGAAPAITALLGSHVEGAIIGAIEAKPHVDSGKLRVLINTGTMKSEAFKDIPSLKEKDIDVAVDVWTGIFAPKDLPAEIKDILHETFKKSVEDPEVIEQYKKLGIDTAYAGPDDFKKAIDTEYKNNGEVLKAAGIIK